MRFSINPGLYLIVNLDWHLKDRYSVIDFCKKVIEGGCSAIQLRFKDAFDSLTFQNAIKLRELTSAYSIPFIVNDRIDIAIVSMADGVHLGQEDLPLDAAIKHCRGIGIGFSTHNLNQVRYVKRKFGTKINYIGFGPVFGTKSKKSIYPPTGLEALEKAVKTIPVPVVAIGGINEKNCREIVKTGCKTVAVLSAIYFSRKPEKTAEMIHSICIKSN